MERHKIPPDKHEPTNNNKTLDKILKANVSFCIIAKKSKLKTNNLLLKKSFLFTMLVLSPNWDYKRNTEKKIIITTKYKLLSKCDWRGGFKLNGIREPIL